MLGIHVSDVARLPGNNTSGGFAIPPLARTKVHPEGVSMNLVSDATGHALDLSMYRA